MYRFVIPNRPFRLAPVTARDKLLEAAVKLIRMNGFGATSVDQLCAEAGVTKGAFFHHFVSKEALGVAAADYWSQSTGAFFAAAPFHHRPRAIDRVLGYLDLRIALLEGPAQSFSCVAGTMVQETFLSSEAIRFACAASIGGNADALEPDIALAMAEAGVSGTTAASLARHVQTVIQGAFILAKADGESQAAVTARDALEHLRRYFMLLFNVGETDADRPLARD